MLKGRRYLVTGATGFLGRFLTKRLLAEGAFVVAVVRKSSDLEKLPPGSEIQYIEDGVANVFDSNSNCNAILHLATDYGRSELGLSSQYKSNVIFPLELIEWNLRTWKAPFLNTDTYFRKYTETNYLGEYIQTKKCFYSILLKNFTNSGISILNLNLEHVFGPELIRTKFVNKLFLELLENKLEIEFTSGNQSRDFIYVYDVIEAYISILKSDSLLSLGKFKEIDIGTGVSISIRDFANLSKEVFKSESILSFGKIPDRQNELQSSFANTEVLKSLGWEAHFSIREAIEDCARLISLEH